ncbi:MAG: ArsR/SmtB family transcription factor [Pseudomonas sp.]
MESLRAIESFAALSQETRLKAFRLLVQHEPDGLPAGEIARRLEVPHNTMSAHLSVLAQAGLVVSRRQSRSIIYRASMSRMQEIVRFLLHDCCSGHPEVCEPIASSLNTCSSLLNDL